ncbi:hypothetical protein [Leptothrix ochracea]|uniref:hypothetical protein n=1 Tax=Leptothrix ochracea TaxID=735331 RepID=UPI0034E1B4EA
MLYALITALVLGVWKISSIGLFKAGDDVGYWLGVSGGVMMLFIFLYPLRKHIRFFHRLGQMKGWLVVHMALGIGGPLLILAHSTFHIGSLNAAVALYSMLIVAGSGIVGRFVYVRITRGVQGEKDQLRMWRDRAGWDKGDMRSLFKLVPSLETRLVEFESFALTEDPGWHGVVSRLFVLPWAEWRVYRACLAEMDAPMRALAEKNQWHAYDRVRRNRNARVLVRKDMDAVLRVAQVSAYERLFALWHVAHIPFVYLLIISAIVHVIAVHAY